MRMKKWNQFIIVVAVAALLPSGTRAQDSPKGPVLSPSQAVLQNWNEIGRKLIAMAEDFPEAKYDFKPVPGTAKLRRATAACGRVKRSVHRRGQGRKTGGR